MITVVGRISVQYMAISGVMKLVVVALAVGVQVVLR